MTDLEYMDRAEALLRDIEIQCDALNDTTDADIDAQRVGGVVTLAFAGGSQIIVNLQKPLHEIWMASRLGGYHYRWKDGAWRDTKTDEDFYTCLTRHASEHGQSVLKFVPPKQR